MSHVTKNFFTWCELTTTLSGLPNNPTTPSHLDNLAFLWRYLNFLREELGQPIIINSAFRTPAVNATIPGASANSWHMQGLAADIRTIPSAMPKLKSLLEQQKGKTIVELIDHETYFHFSV